MIELIETALGNCKYSHICKCVTKNSFENVNHNEFYIYDEKDDGSENPVRIVTINSKFQLTVVNKQGIQICLIKTDNCLLTDDTKKCDCILIGETKCYLVEIKTSSSGQRNKARKDAREQLGTTINLLRQNGITFENFEAYAVICFATMEPRIINSASNSAKAVFFELYNMKLQEKNVISFSEENPPRFVSHEPKCQN